MGDIDELLKGFEEPKKPAVKEDSSQQKKPAPPSFTVHPKNESSVSDNRKVNIPNPQFPVASEQTRPSILKPQFKPAVDQSFDIDAILQGRSNQHSKPAETKRHLQPAKNSATSSRRDSLSDWLNDDRAKPVKYSPRQPLVSPGKIKTNVQGKPAIDLNPDDFFSNMNTRDQSATKAQASTTKPSASNYYLGNSRYKPGKICLIRFKSVTSIVRLY